MRLSWPKMIILAYLTFMGGMIFMVTQSFRQTTDLEYDDYYQREVNYQDRIDATQRVKNLIDQPSIILGKEIIDIKIPAHLTGFNSGNIHFFHITNEKNDFDITLNKPVYKIEKSKMEMGLYRVELTWKNNGLDYYFSEKVLIEE